MKMTYDEWLESEYLEPIDTLASSDGRKAWEAARASLLAELLEGVDDPTAEDRRDFEGGDLFVDDSVVRDLFNALDTARAESAALSDDNDNLSELLGDAVSCVIDIQRALGLSPPPAPKGVVRKYRFSDTARECAEAAAALRKRLAEVEGELVEANALLARWADAYENGGSPPGRYPMQQPKA